MQKLIKITKILILLLTVGSLLMTAGCVGQSESSSVSMKTVDNPISEQVIVTQSDGSQVILQKEAERIIVANADAAELLTVIGAQDRIVGGTDTILTDPSIIPYIPKSAVSLGDWRTPNVETILSLKPDVIIAYDSFKPKNLDQLTSANISIIYLDCYRIPTLPSDARSLGNLTGNQQEAEEYISFLEKNLGIVSERLSGLEQDEWPRVYFESYTDYTTSGIGSAAEELLLLTCGNNIAGDNPLSSIKVNPEWIISENPEIVIKAASSTIKNYEDYPEIREDIIARTGMDSVSAVKNNEVYVINGNYIYGPRSFAGVMHFAKIFYPELFEDMNPDSALEEFSEKYMPGLDYSDVIYPEY